MNDNLGDRMKLYEGIEADRTLIPLLPIIARIDGRSFHTFTKGMNRPYDIDLSNMMIDTTVQLVKETNACIGYTQSDEITLIWYSPTFESQVWFDGRISKMTSLLAAHATLYFNKLLAVKKPDYVDRNPVFDARVWNVPNKTEAANTLLWRELDASKNSISMAAHAYYSTSELHKKNGSEKQEMLFQKGINWNDYPAFFKRGTFVQRREVKKKFTTAEISLLPEKHAARKYPDLEFIRYEIVRLVMPPFSKLTNRVGVIFDAEEATVAPMGFNTTPFIESIPSNN